MVGPRKLRFAPGMAKKIYHLRRSQEVDLIHCHNLWNWVSYLAELARRKIDAPLIISPRGALFPWPLLQSSRFKRASLSFFQRESLNKCSCIHVTDTSELEAVRELGIRAPIAVIPNGVNFDEFSSLSPSTQCRVDLGLPATVRNILFFSRIHPKKGLKLLVDVFNELADHFSNWNLLIAGAVDDRAYQAEVQKRVSDGGWQDRIRFLGLVTGERRRIVFGASDLFVLPTESENFGMAIAEALAAGLPVVTTTGTPWRSIAETESGWWIELSKEALKGALMEAMSMDSEQLSRLGDSAVRLAETKSWTSAASEMRDVYGWVLGQAERPNCVYFY